MNKKVVIHGKDLITFCKECLMYYGMSDINADITARALVQTDMWGTHSHGTKNLYNYIQKTLVGAASLTAEITEIMRLPSVAILDANHSLGYVPSTVAMNLACDMAEENGIGMTFVKNSCHFGAAACYANIAAERGMVGCAMSNVDKKMTIPGAKGVVMGQNPIAFGAPYPSKETPSILLDISTSNVAMLKILQAKKDGKQIPCDWISDKDGIPTNDPSRYPDEGALLPMGQHKGYGIAVFIEILTSIITGGPTSMSGDVVSWCFELASPNNVSHSFIAINSSKICGEGVAEERIKQMADTLRSAPKATGTEALYVPGEIEWNKYNQALNNGLVLPQDVLDELIKLSNATGISLPIAN